LSFERTLSTDEVEFEILTANTALTFLESSTGAEGLRGLGSRGVSDASTLDKIANFADHSGRERDDLLAGSAVIRISRRTVVHLISLVNRDADITLHGSACTFLGGRFASDALVSAKVANRAFHGTRGRHRFGAFLSGKGISRATAVAGLASLGVSSKDKGKELHLVVKN